MINQTKKALLGIQQLDKQQITQIHLETKSNES